MADKIEGPVEKIIPEKRYLSCMNCIYLKQGDDAAASFNFSKKSRCTNHQAPFLGNELKMDFINGVITPGIWCPFPPHHSDQY